MTLPIERVTTVLGAAGSLLLTDLPTTKLELGLTPPDTSQDAWLATNAIPQVSAAIRRHCKRPFAPEYLQDEIQFGLDPAFAGIRFAGVNEMPLARWPLLSVVSVTQSLPNGTTQVLVAGTDFIADMAKGRLLRLASSGLVQRWEALPLTVLYTAGYGAMVQEVNAVPASPGPYTVTVQQASTFACGQSVAYASGTALALVTGTPAQGQYALNAAAGQYTFAPADQAQPLTFAYATVSIPPELVEICLKLITARFRAKARDPLLIQDTQPDVGTQRYWFDTSQTGRFPPDIQDALDDYRVPTLA